jgi:hypothetical protein
MSSTWPSEAGAPSNVAATVEAFTPEPSSVTVHSIDDRSSVSKITPCGTGDVIVIVGGAVSRKTSRDATDPSGSPAVANLWHGSSDLSSTVHSPSPAPDGIANVPPLAMDVKPPGELPLR